MNSEDRRMNEIFSVSRDVTATPELSTRVSSAATQVHRKPQSRLVFAFAAGATVMLLGVLTMLPQKARAGSLLERMQQAVRDATTIHGTCYMLTKEGWKRNSEVWYSHEDWRVTELSRDSIWAGNKIWRYQPDQKIAIESDRIAGESPNGMGGAFALRSSYAAMNRKGFNFELHYGSERTENGKTLATVMVTRPGHETEREVFVVEKASDLPLSGESQVLTKEGWRARMKWEFAYNVPVPATVFQARFPQGTRVLNRASLEAEWKKDLTSVLVSANIDGSPVRIRDVYVNKAGGVFVLWTGKIGGRDYRLTLTDSRGKTYTRASFDPGIEPAEWMGTELVFIDGEVVDGAWFVPVEEGPRLDARSFTLKVSQVQYPKPKFPAGKAVGFKSRRPFESDTFEVFNREKVKPQVTVEGEIEIPASPPMDSLLPLYTPLVGDAPKTDAAYNGLALQALKHYWMLRLGEPWREYGLYHVLVPPHTLEGEQPGAVQVVVPGNSLPTGCDPAALAKLEEVLTRSLKLDEDSPYGASGFDWFELSAVQKALGKAEEAEASLKKAEEVRPEVRWRR